MRKTKNGKIDMILKMMKTIKPINRQPRSKLIHKIPFEQKVITQDGEVYQYAFTKSGKIWYLFLHFIKTK